MAHDNCKAAIIIFLGIRLGKGLEKLRRPKIQDAQLSRLPGACGAHLAFKVGLCQT